MKSVLYHLALVVISLGLAIVMSAAIVLVGGVIAYVFITMGLRWLVPALVFLALSASIYLNLAWRAEIKKKQYFKE